MEDLRTLTTGLRELTGQLMRRCTEAEARVTDLQRQVEDLQAQLKGLEAEKDELNMRFQHLQTGLAATGRDPEQVALLKERYLAMVSEIDACIAKLQG